jgi:hypothetical protein
MFNVCFLRNCQDKDTSAVVVVMHGIRNYGRPLQFLTWDESSYFLHEILEYPPVYYFLRLFVRKYSFRIPGCIETGGVLRIMFNL